MGFLGGVVCCSVISHEGDYSRIILPGSESLKSSGGWRLFQGETIGISMTGVCRALRLPNSYQKIEALSAADMHMKQELAIRKIIVKRYLLLTNKYISQTFLHHHG